MRFFFALWFWATVAQSRFNAEAPKTIDRMVAKGEGDSKMVKIGLREELSDVHDYQGSTVCVNLNMRGAKLISREAVFVSELAKKKSVKSLVVKNCLLDIKDLTTILSSVLWKSDVRCLALHNCRLCADALQLSLDSSLIADEDAADIGNRSNEDSIAAYKSGNKNRKSCINDQLTLLDVSFNHLDTLSFKHLSAIIKKCSKLEVLALDGNKMNIRDVQIVLDVVRVHPSITHISLSDCGLTDDCMEFISFGMKMNRNISTLDLSLNKISSEGIQIFLDGFRAGGGRQLETLDLSYCPLGDFGVQNLARAISLGHFQKLKHLTLKEVGATAVSLEKLFHSFPYGSVLESIDVSGNILIPSNKTKKEKLGYSPKNLKKKILSYTPHISSAIKSFSGSFSAHLQSAGELLDAKKTSFLELTAKKTKYGPKSKKILKSKKGKKMTGKNENTEGSDDEANLSKTKKGKKLLKKSKLSKLLRGKGGKENVNKKSKVRISSSITKEIILGEDKVIEKSRMKVIRGLLHACKIARNLKRVGLAKVGLTDFSCVLLKKEFDKREAGLKRVEQKVDTPSSITANEIKKTVKKKTEKSTPDSDKTFGRSPQVPIPSEPELITNLEGTLSQAEKDIDSSIYKHLRPDDKISNESLTKSDYELATEILLEETQIGENPFKMGQRNITVVVSLNGLSPKSVEDITEIIQFS